MWYFIETCTVVYAFAYLPRHNQISEEQVLQAFSGCGAVVDSRMCGDPNSALRFAFIEFDGEEAVTKARPAWRRGLHALR